MPIELPPGTASYRGDRNPEPKKRQILLVVGLIIAVVFFAFWLFGALVNGLVWLIPPSVERQLGTFTVPVFEQMAEPSAAQDSLNQLLDRLEANLPPEQQQDHDYQVLYIPDATVNAIAIPGDRVIIYRGLLAQTESENELMMVLGHELGHFANRDHLRRLSRGLVLQLLIAVFFGDTGGLQDVAISGLSSISNAQFSQGQELQADEFGLNLLQQTYGHVAGATDFFERLSQQEGANIDFLATHPNSNKRVQRLERTIAKGYDLGERSPLPAPLADL
ncbi:M48 family metallopeptidase [Leptolyngbya sp. FACHB-671]|uniref:M48 family metallopeptidase n=1 Tax=Leptolyngbya sp. FACHB-671 TaxID=2692812 RepID=UPI00168947D1|nr:M48 family metallopeptidase [Leptolyngbya sp. FACHB-671]MBD2066392.1 M48 family metallopeptidase [Leptolyngbya sp. FACHB-671]